MPELIPPVVTVHRSFLTAMAGFAAEGRGTPADQTMIGREIRDWSSRWESPEVFSRYVETLRADVHEESPRPSGHVPCTTLWWVDGTEYLGRLAIRHRLNDSLLQAGGHIGYDVAPSARRRGHATAMLRTALPMVARLGIGRALVTCDAGNTASRKVIEANGGILEDRRGDMLRFWITTP